MSNYTEYLNNCTEINQRNLVRFFEKKGYDVCVYPSGRYSKDYLDSLDFKLEVLGTNNNHFTSIFIGKENNKWFLDINNETKVKGVNITQINELDFLLTMFDITTLEGNPKDYFGYYYISNLEDINISFTFHKYISNEWIKTKFKGKVKDIKGLYTTDRNSFTTLVTINNIIEND